jgi:hypothetical protein
MLQWEVQLIIVVIIVFLKNCSMVMWICDAVVVIFYVPAVLYV